MITYFSIFSTYKTYKTTYNVISWNPQLNLVQSRTLNFSNGISTTYFISI